MSANLEDSLRRAKRLHVGRAALNALGPIAFVVFAVVAAGVFLDQVRSAKHEERTMRIHGEATRVEQVLTRSIVAPMEISKPEELSTLRSEIQCCKTELAERGAALERLIEHQEGFSGVLPTMIERVDAALVLAERTIDRSAELMHLRESRATDAALAEAQTELTRTVLAAVSARGEARKGLSGLLDVVHGQLEDDYAQARRRVYGLFQLAGLVGLGAIASLWLSLREGRARRHADEAERAVRSLADIVPGRDSKEVFERLAEALARSLGVRWAIVGRVEAREKRVRTLAFWNGDRIGEGFAYDLAGTPCERVTEVGLYHCEEGVAGRFPQDALLRDVGVIGYIGRPLRDEENRVIGILNAFHDARFVATPSQIALFDSFVRRAEAELARFLAVEKLHASEARHRTVLQTLADGVLTIDAAGRIQAMNLAAERMFAWPGGEAIGRDLTELMPARFREPHRAGLKRCIETGESRLVGGKAVEAEGLRRDGTTFHVELSISRFEANGEIFFTGTLRDVTERRRFEVEIGRLARAAESAADAIILMDAKGEIVWVNPAFSAMTGYEDQEVLGRDLSVLRSGAHPAEFFESIWAEIRTGRIWSGSLISRHKDGTVYHVSSTIAPVQSDLGEITGFVAVQRDVTTEVRRERDLVALQMELAERAALLDQQNRELTAAREAALLGSRIKSEFLANMSHEIRTPMNGILGFLSLLTETELNPEQREYLNVMRVSAEALLTLINDILDLSKIEAGKIDFEREEFSIADLVEDVADLLAPRAHEKSLELLWELTPEVPPILRGDPKRLRQVLVNLAGNAVKFTDRGEVVISGNVSATEKGTALLILRVHDTGIGIPADKIDRLFKPFSQVDGSRTRRHGGAGLGLAISKRLVELMGGSVQAESEANVGSTFTLTLTLDRVEGARTGAGSPAATTSGKRALVVDANPASRTLFEKRLRSLGCETEGCAGADDWVERRREAKREGRPIHLVLLSVGSDSRSASKAVRAVRADLEVRRTRLILAGTPTCLRLLADLAKAVDSTLTKPVKPEALRQTITEMLGTTPNRFNPAAPQPPDRPSSFRPPASSL